MHHQSQASIEARIDPNLAALANEENIGSLDTLFVEHGTVKRFQPGEVVFMEGDDAHSVYRIASGMVLACVITRDGRRQIARFVSDGGSMGLTARDTHSYTAEAVDCVDVQICPRAMFDAAILENRTIREEMMQAISVELAASRDLMVLLGRMTAIEKTASFLVKLADQLRCSKAGFIRLPMTRADIADYLGLTLETVSRLLNGLNRDGVIDMPTPDRFRVADRDALHSLATPI